MDVKLAQLKVFSYDDHDYDANQNDADLNDQDDNKEWIVTSHPIKSLLLYDVSFGTMMKMAVLRCV